MSFNKIIVVGNLGRDPELRQTPQGVALCELAVATNEKRKDEKITTWFRVTLWGTQAELAKKHLVKGKLVYIAGSLRTREWNDKDGHARTTLEVNGSEIQFIDFNTDDDITTNAK